MLSVYIVKPLTWTMDGQCPVGLPEQCKLVQTLFMIEKKMQRYKVGH